MVDGAVTRGIEEGGEASGESFGFTGDVVVVNADEVRVVGAKVLAVTAIMVVVETESGVKCGGSAAE